MIGRAGRQSRARLGRQRDWPLSTRHNVLVAERSKAVDLKSGTCRLERCLGPESLATIELMRDQQLSAAHASWKQEVVARSRPAAGRSRYLPPWAGRVPVLVNVTDLLARSAARKPTPCLKVWRVALRLRQALQLSPDLPGPCHLLPWSTKFFSAHLLNKVVTELYSYATMISPSAQSPC